MLRAGALSVDDLRKVVPVIDLSTARAARSRSSARPTGAPRRRSPPQNPASAAGDGSTASTGEPDDPADDPAPGD